MNQNPIFSLRDVDPRLPKAMQVYALLRDAIISVQIAPEQAISEKELSALLQVSRTPIREALLQLAAENLITIVPSGGTYVSRISMKDVLSGQIVRDTLEMRLLHLAARNFSSAADRNFELNLFMQQKAADRQDPDEFFTLDVEFHRLICDLSGYPSVWPTIQRATGQLDRIRNLAFKVERHYDEVLGEHREIYESIRSGDVETAERIFQVQLDSTFPSLEKLHAAMPDLLGEADLSGFNDPFALVGRR